MPTTFRPRLLGGTVDLGPVMNALANVQGMAQTAEAKAEAAEAMAVKAEATGQNARQMHFTRDVRYDALQDNVVTLQGVASTVQTLSQASDADRLQLNQRLAVLEQERLALALRVKALEDARLEFDRQTKTLPALTLLASTTEQAFVWKKPFTNATYQLRPIIIQSGLNLSSVTVTEKTGTRTAAGVTLVVKAVGIAVSSGAVLDVIAWREAVG